jgi:hypothetical protein
MLDKLARLEIVAPLIALPCEITGTVKLGVEDFITPEGAYDSKFTIN